ncbi:MAG: zinc ABC transporter substrate-binding protein [Deltaproteobacteria bacterium]|nr:zinc ABC transporter substrate-binding protein [Deltaproteobacteria bacterium]
MMVNTARRACMVFLLALVAFGCSKNDAQEAAAPKDERAPSVYTVNYPLAYFAERLAPEGVEIVFPAPPDVDPAFWKPAPDAIGRYQRADLILLNGAGYARWTRYATLPKSRVAVTTDGCRDELLQASETVTHQHGLGGDGRRSRTRGHGVHHMARHAPCPLSGKPRPRCSSRAGARE